MVNKAQLMHNRAATFTRRQAAILLKHYGERIEKAAEDGLYSVNVSWTECYSLSNRATRIGTIDEIEDIANKKMEAEGFTVVRDAASWKISW